MVSYVIPDQVQDRILQALREFRVRPMGSLATIVELEHWVDAQPGELDSYLRVMEAQGLVVCVPPSGAVKVVSLPEDGLCRKT